MSKSLKEFTNMQYGMYDRPGPVSKTETSNLTPITVLNQVSSIQLTEPRPEVDDDDYAPLHKKDLISAVAELLKDVSDDNVKSIYRQIHNVIKDEKADTTIDENHQRKRKGKVNSDQMEKRIAKIIAEQFRDSDLRRMKQDFDSEFGPEEEEVEEEEPADYEETKLIDIAKEIGMAGPAGVKNMLYKLESQLKQFGEIPDEEFDAMVEFAAGEYVDLLRDSGLVDDEDADFLYSNINQVVTLPSFKFFLYKAIVAPAARQMEKMNAAGKGGDFVELALKKYAGVNKTRLLQVLQQASDDPFVAEKTAK
jgi:hypothetical protein